MNITDEQISKIFELASMEDRLANREITTSDITEALIEIERKLYSFSADCETGSLQEKKILIADDLELSIYQLSTVLKRIGVTPIVARHKDEALSELQKVQFDTVIIDLFMPDSLDGLDLIQEAVKKRTEHCSTCKVVVISGTDDASLIEKCYELGVDYYIQKGKDWHTKLLKFLSTSFQTENNVAYSRFIINNNIVSYTIKIFNDTKIFDSIVKNINSSMYAGMVNVFFDLRDVNAFEVDNAYVFAQIYKTCAENGGKFVLVNPSSSVKEALAFAYLEDAIPCTNSVEEAVSLIMK